MDYAKVEQLWNEYKDLHIIIGNDERTFHEVFYQDINELDIWIYKVMEHDPELTDDYEIVLNTLYHYLRNFYFDDYNEGEINPNIRLDNTGRIGNLLIDIKIMSTQENILDTIFPIFHHELTHAYEYYGKLKKGVSTNNLRDDSTYDIRMFNSIIKNPNLKPLEKNLASLIYFSDPSEYNGWINTFYSEIYKIDVKNTDYRTIIANTTTWKRIAFLNNVVNLMKQVQKTEDQQKLMRINNILTNQRVKDYQTLVNETEQRYQKLRFDCVKEFVEIINKMRTK
jgi:hypothetical protein